MIDQARLLDILHVELVRAEPNYDTVDALYNNLVAVVGSASALKSAWDSQQPDALYNLQGLFIALTRLEQTYDH